MRRTTVGFSVTVLAAAVVGLAVSTYLTVSHYQGVPLACTVNSLVDCAAVTSSSFSVIPTTSIPISILGMAWSVISGGLAAVVIWRSPGALITWIQALWGAAGMLFVLYLVYAELLVIHRICEWCTVLHIAVLITFLMGLAQVSSASRRDSSSVVPEHC